MAESLEDENTTPLRFFKSADTNFNNVLTVDELKNQVRITIPQAFAGLNFKKLGVALDVNNNGVIEQDEFISMLDRAKKSSADTS